MDEKIEIECSSMNVGCGHLSEPRITEDAQLGVQYEEHVSCRGHCGLSDAKEKPEKHVL